MIKHLAKKLVEAFVTLWILGTLTFFMLRILPGGPFDQEKVWQPAIKKNIEAKYGLDQSLWIQYRRWLTDTAHGDLRESFHYINYSVQEIIWEGSKKTAELGMWATIFSFVLGIFFGVISAIQKDKWLDRWLGVFTTAGMSLPNYLFASLLIYFLALQFRFLPVALMEGWDSRILPVITLSLRPLALITRLTRSSMIDILYSDFVRTAKAKGLSPFNVYFKHALRNAIIPTLTIMGPITANLVTGSFVVEKIFQIPGIGAHFVTSILNRDFPLILGITLFYGVILISANFISDILLTVADPRMEDAV